MPQVTLDQIETITKAALMRHGADPFPAAEVARAVRSAESYGNKICGLYYVESYCLQLESGRVQGRVTPSLTQPKPAVVNVNAEFGFAQPAFALGLVPALEAARVHGVATLSVAHAHTCTSLGYFTEQIARAGCVALGFTNASPIVAPPGGKTGVLGTNPVSFSVPDRKGGIAVHMDQSTTTVALGKITMAKAAGERIPSGWAVDANGRPTTDPEAALAGSLVSMGGYKGWGFAVMAELFAAAFTGSVLSRDVKPLKSPDGPPHDLGQFYVLFAPDSSELFYERLEALAAAVGQDQEGRLPGQHRRAMEQFDVASEVWSRILELADVS